MTIVVPPYISPFIESEDTVRARLQAAAPDGLTVQAGTWSDDWIEINVAEFVRAWNSLGMILAQAYVSWATGQQLDAWALAYGLTRGTGTASYGTERFFSSVDGTAIGPATVVEVPQTDPNLPRLRYQTTNVASAIIPAAVGYVDVPILALDVGVEFDQPVGAVTLLDTSIDNITAISNTVPLVGGTDPETDDQLRQRVLEQAQLPTGAGTQVDYVVWGMEVPGVGDVAVYAQWDLSGENPGILDGRQNGSVLLVLRNSALGPVDWIVAQAAQVHLDPARQPIALFEHAEWTLLSGPAAVTDDTANVQAGSSSTQLAFTGAGTAEIVMDRNLDLSRFAATDEIWLWVKASDWSQVTSLQLAFQQDGANYFAAGSATIAPTGTAIPVVGAAWWLWRIQPGQFTLTGAPNWAAIAAVQITATVTSAIGIDFDYMTERTAAGNLGEGGRAPVGADVTCISPSAQAIDVTITDTLLAPGYTLVDAPGQTNAQALVSANLAAFFLALPPGQSVRFIDIATVIHNTAGIIDFELTLPGASGAPPAVPVSVFEYAILGTLAMS